jgi:hypothetical protein
MATQVGNGSTTKVSESEAANRHSRPESGVGGAYFETLVNAHHAVTKATDEALIATLQAEYKRIEAAFQGAYGNVAHAWFGTTQPFGVVLTTGGHLYLTSPVGNARIVDLCVSAMAIQTEARGNGTEKEIAACGYLLYLAVVSLLQTLDAGVPVHEDAIKAGARQLEKASGTYAARQKRHARMQYSAGVIAGSVGIFLISLATFWILPKLISHLVDAPQLEHIVEMFTACMNAGGAGALLSVMSRMSSDSLRIRYEEGPTALMLAGAFRPFIGGISGVAVYVLYKAQLLPVQVPSGASDFFTFGGLAFLAGFSERLAQDALMQTDRKALSLAKPS